MRRLLTILLFSAATAGCGAFPRDAAGTTDRIEQTGTMRVAILPTTPDARPAFNLLGDYAARHGARVALEKLPGEHALRALEEGKLDAVVGHFAHASPWNTVVSLSKAVGRGEPRDSKQPALRIARRNGENALILATDRMIAGDTAP